MDRQARMITATILSLSQIYPISVGLCSSTDYPKDHIACQEPSPYALFPQGVSLGDKQFILFYHNSLRAKQQAEDMQLTIWDDGLAYVSQKWSESCSTRPNFTTTISLNYAAGKNLAVGYSSWRDVISVWYSGFSLLNATGVSSNSTRIGNAIQIVRNSTAKIGCGFSTCSNLRGRKFYVCHYMHSEYETQPIGFPYTKGTPCADCPGRCTKGLCDCNGLVCPYGQKLDLKSCICTCSSSVSKYLRGCTPDLSATYPTSQTSAAPAAATTSSADIITSGAFSEESTPKFSVTAPVASTMVYPTGKISSSTVVPEKISSSTVVPEAEVTSPVGMPASGSLPDEPTWSIKKTATSTVNPTIEISSSSLVPTAVVTSSPEMKTTDTSQVSVSSTFSLSAAAPASTAYRTVEDTSQAEYGTVTSTPALPPTPATTSSLDVTTSAVSLVSPTSQNEKSGCPSPSYPSTHTACLSISPSAESPRGVTVSEKALIVNYHNYLRRLQVATDMQIMVWDDEVAYIAQKWSDNCDYRHDTERYVPGKYSAGQNIAYGFSTWNDTMSAWYDEVRQFTYGSSSNNFGSIGHYTQMVWNSTAKIGCGATTCTNLKAVFYVCNYAPAGNIFSQVPTPYTYGPPCSACPSRCNAGLCDCGGIVCKNGGTLNLNTCQCTCQSPYTGMPDCNLNCTGVVDKPYCGTQWPRSFCSLYNNVPYDCPRLCSVCLAA